jgi:hypothetical protein
MKYLCAVDFTKGDDQTQGQYEIEAVDAYHADEVLQITLRKFCLPDVKIFCTSVKSIEAEDAILDDVLEQMRLVYPYQSR